MPVDRALKLPFLGYEERDCGHGALGAIDDVPPDKLLPADGTAARGWPRVDLASGRQGVTCKHEAAQQRQYERA
jgi:hypothetical protein